MTTERFNKTAGSPVMQGVDDPSMMIVGDSVPDWVQVPNELGGGRRPVTRAYTRPCPACGDHDVRVLLAGDLSVAECEQRGFLWFRSEFSA